MTMKHSIVNLGCKVNRVESDAFERSLRQAGSHPSEGEEADLVVVNTCTVTGDAEKKTRKAVRRALRENPQATVVVTGCAAAISPEVFAAMDARIVVVPKQDVEGFLEKAVPRTCAPGSDDHDAPFLLTRQRIGVKVQDGCDNACTYCIVHVARGPARSRNEEAIVADVKRLAREGIREIVLTGINLGSYGHGSSASGSRTLAALLERLLVESEPFTDEAGGLCRFRLSSIEPGDIDDALLDLMASADGRICRHLHLPLQAGSTKVLSEMARPYTAEAYAKLVEKARKTVPRLALSTDVIVGFPGETDEDFAQTLALSEACAFSSMHVFPYSRREGTPAAVRIDQVPFEMKAERAAALREMARRLREADRKSRCGTVELALVERRGHATTESYHEVDVALDVPEGALVPYAFS